MRSSRQNAAIEVFVYVKHIAYLFGKHAPLVVAEIVYHDEEHLIAVADGGENAVRHYAVRHQRALRLSLCPRRYPVYVVVLDKLAPPYVGFLLLHLQHLGH